MESAVKIDGTSNGSAIHADLISRIAIILPANRETMMLLEKRLSGTLLKKNGVARTEPLQASNQAGTL
ncbi:hypothetical protein IEI94_04435 [Halomonas sp. ML-15]|uniref:hypothetical protein n=1 Tax=Halomonas sp. ML-15 TaxID=2773305 RepID=UPI001746A3B9|nr:hypothetical protein [Halomonas sp. ML-15]MBD3895096.1 hypothetical protein [Halomonas sp. ML-15]